MAKEREHGSARRDLKRRLLELLQERRELTSQDVATSFGIRRNVASAMLHYLREQGVIETDAKGIPRNGSRGRRALAYRLVQA